MVALGLAQHIAHEGVSTDICKCKPFRAYVLTRNRLAARVRRDVRVDALRSDPTRHRLDALTSLFSNERLAGNKRSNGPSSRDISRRASRPFRSVCDIDIAWNARDASTPSWPGVAASVISRARRSSPTNRIGGSTLLLRQGPRRTAKRLEAASAREERGSSKARCDAVVAATHRRAICQYRAP